ncbi:MAG: hypothetical protein FJW40_20735 [Acidobacteria bacterium]|nr:hypothetical protein [Acidobacteriota bacterium]
MRIAAYALAVLPLVAQNAEGPRILRPTDRSAVPVGALQVVVKAPVGAALTLDGAKVALIPLGGEAQTALLKLAAGRHEIALAGGNKLEVFAGEGVPAGWKPYRTHPPGAAACTACHTNQGGGWAVKGDTTGENCRQCHKLEGFAKGHMHNTETLNECQMCHDTHGGVEKLNLKVTREVACKLCHG